MSAQNLRRPGFEVKKAGRPSKTKVPEPIKEAPGSSSELSSVPSESEDEGPRTSVKRRKVTKDSDEEYIPEAKGKATSRKTASKNVTPASEEITEESEDEFVVSDVSESKKRKVSDGTHKPRLDDGDEKMYQKRLREWSKSRKEAREEAQGMDVEDDLEEWHKPHPTIPDEEFGDGYRLPGDIHPSLFPYQKVAVKWLWELHGQNAGGILGDEMGLGKTIQMISFLAGLHHSGMLDKPILIVSPGAVLSQWASEFHTWWPAMRVAILHKSGSGMLHAKNGDIDSDEEDVEGSSKPNKRAQFAAKKIVDRAFKHGHVLITTYEGLETYSDLISEKEWGYAVLDEGHKIRNPDANVTLNCKKLKVRYYTQ
jgi:DNA excision repair protein ERCC-6